ncbi:hypothetical protein JHW43_004116 [Diplocarpon mali]|nr:hypothetical protein JHW43_004116 [Diplocarpon mali]
MSLGNRFSLRRSNAVKRTRPVKIAKFTRPSTLSSTNFQPHATVDINYWLQYEQGLSTQGIPTGCPLPSHGPYDVAERDATTEESMGRVEREKEGDGESTGVGSLKEETSKDKSPKENAKEKEGTEEGTKLSLFKGFLTLCRRKQKSSSKPLAQDQSEAGYANGATSRGGNVAGQQLDCEEALSRVQNIKQEDGPASEGAGRSLADENYNRYAKERGRRADEGRIARPRRMVPDSTMRTNSRPHHMAGRERRAEEREKLAAEYRSIEARAEARRNETVDYHVERATTGRSNVDELIYISDNKAQRKVEVVEDNPWRLVVAQTAVFALAEDTASEDGLREDLYRQ